MPVIQANTTEDGVTLMSAGGGNAGNLSPKRIIDIFGSRQRIFIVDDAGLLALISNQIESCSKDGSEPNKKCERARNALDKTHIKAITILSCVILALAAFITTNLFPYISALAFYSVSVFICMVFIYKGTVKEYADYVDNKTEKFKNQT